MCAYASRSILAFEEHSPKSVCACPILRARHNTGRSSQITKFPTTASNIVHPIIQPREPDILLNPRRERLSQLPSSRSTGYGRPLPLLPHSRTTPAKSSYYNHAAAHSRTGSEQVIPYPSLPTEMEPPFSASLESASLNHSRNCSSFGQRVPQPSLRGDIRPLHQFPSRVCKALRASHLTRPLRSSSPIPPSSHLLLHLIFRLLVSHPNRLTLGGHCPHPSHVRCE